jgi:hypothetical protein
VICDEIAKMSYYMACFGGSPYREAAKIRKIIKKKH